MADAAWKTRIPNAADYFLILNKNYKKKTFTRLKMIRGENQAYDGKTRFN